MKITSIYSKFIQGAPICTDTRKVTKGCIFFALKGDNFNGNSFAEEAINNGALLSVIDDESFYTLKDSMILVQDVLKTLQSLATHHREQLNIPIISLTGSNGKTTTKELINAVLSKKYNTTATQGNLNNHIGVPLTLLSMSSDTEIGIVEMGANHLKEIELLSKISLPDYGYITNFGKAHIEGFGSLEGVVKGKTELYKYLKEENKIAFINTNDERQVIESTNLDKVTFGSGNSDYTIELLDASNVVKVKYNNVDITSNLIGLYNFNNIAAAIAIGVFFKVSENKIKEAIEDYIPTNNRSQRIEKKGHNIILDAYNANPTSMMAAIKNFEQSEGINKVLFLGDMFELGDTAKEEHQIVTDYLSKNKIGNTYLIGTNFFKTSTEAAHVNLFKTFEDLKEFIANLQLKKCTILIKASRGMALERIVELL
ncbi:UDP-N-acetylmuramoyl-tripeptide--D-alanyl-D-alanine ligase [Patiriisocius hiemis]|uniref:UDP-N-acetylmuramoyl-tripeptide--D-alanyl-D-alanine ligase n=1 Tax=Patiriisocius hiemis TaxID=3075604 RepID=A0ABU2YI48_9FLAO|nr:UDP-N-acetylmuramoyl-tripeptide--D-alanyl-D-alanine ligase [Constantimarinum sp. W242]MDT0556930.1 UDP-N-acetylmuramoyl-tripeptide--D-alanyl-D-alanine ligase [Constantimarinum sp. W242]